MSKKQFVIFMLEKLEWSRVLAKDLKKFIMLDILDNAAVNGIVQLLKEMAAYVNNKELKTHMLHIASKLDEIKSLELHDHIQDEKDWENLLLSL